MRTRRRPILFLMVPLFVVALLVPLSAPLGAEPQPTRRVEPRFESRPLTLQDRVAIARAEGLFAAEEERGQLEVEAVFIMKALVEGGARRGSLEVLVDLAPLAGRGAGGESGNWFRLSLVSSRRGGDWRVRHEEVDAGELAGVEHWTYEATVELPDDLRDAVVVVEEPFSGLWGAAWVEPSEEHLEPPGEAKVSMRAGVWGEAPAPGTAGGTAPATAGAAPGETAPEAGARAASGRSTTVRILPPRGRRLEGRTRIQTLVADPEVARVDFLLDGAQVASEEKEPFDTHVELAGPGHPQTLTAVAHGADGRRLGEDSLALNAVVRPFRVSLTRVAGGEGGALEVEADVSVPADAVLDRVELYLNQSLLARASEPPFRARAEAATPTGQDYVRAVAYLADGSSVEDVRLLGPQGVVEELDVRLVELYVVVTDREGRPVEGLSRDDFELRFRGRRQTIERLTYAEDVPLLLGLVIDTSKSMELIMLQTKQAAAEFLNQVLSPGDEAFLVDFSTRPRLRQRATGDLMQLVMSFSGMRAEGFTALYDAIIFSLLEFADGPGRRALVLLTDGDDYKSHFGANRCVQYGRRTGVPVYIVALSGPNSLRGSTRLELEAVTERTGGRLYFIRDPAELPGSYAEIDRELRSQYLMTFYADSDLGAEDLREVEVDVGRRGLEARVVVGAATD